MSVSGLGGSGRAERIEISPPDADATAAVDSQATTGRRSRTSSTTGRHAVLAGLAARTSAATTAASGVDLAGFSAHVNPDGTIVGSAADASGPLGVLNALALRPADGPGPFDSIADKSLLSKIAAKLAETHGALTGDAPDDMTALAWRQARASCLHLMEQAAMRAFALGDKQLARSIVATLCDAIKAEPWRQVRDFAYESLLGRAETKKLPEVTEAREAIYPSRPPYEKWLEDGKIDITLYVDDNGSKIEDQIWFFKSQGFKHTANADGSHTLKMPKSSDGKPAIEITIPPKNGEPALFEKMNDPKVDVIGYMGHAGYGHRVDHALAHGVGGTGENKLVFLLQCWGEGNANSLEKAYPDAQFLSTTAPTTDNYDWVMLSRMIEQFRNKAGWEDMQKKTIADLKREFKGDGEHSPEHWDGHYFFPTTRSTLVKHYDRDGDGTPDQNDHIFNVIYPKRVDAAGGYDPVVQPIPAYALDGSALGKAVGDLSLSVRYNHFLSPADERKLPWNPEKWRPGGFFQPEANDNRAFQFTRAADGTVQVALSTKFAHTQPEDLSRMLAYEAGIWMGKEAGLDATTTAALGVGLLERIVHQQGTWFAEESGMLDEAWAEEALLMQRYGLEGFTFGELERMIGDPEDYGPEHFKAILDKVKTLPNAEKLADRAPTRVGKELSWSGKIEFGGRFVGEAELQGVLRQLGIEGAKIKSYAPQFFEQNQPVNLVMLCEKDGKTFQVSLGIDSERTVQAAARLDLDMAKKVDYVAGRVLEQLLTEGGALTRADVHAAYEKHRAQGKPFAEALSAALADLRPKCPPGTAAPNTLEIWRLEQIGLVPPDDGAKIEHALNKFYPGTTTAKYEKDLFAWVADVAKRHRLDLGALYQKYLKEVTSGAGGPEARAKGIAAVIAALPRNAGKPESVTVNDVLSAIADSDLIAQADRAATLATVRDKLGVSTAELAVEAFKASFAPGTAGLAQGTEAFSRAIAGGKSLPDAYEAAFYAMRRNGFPPSFLNIDAFTRLGAIATGSPEAAALRDRQTELLRRAESEESFFFWASQVDGRRGLEAFRDLYFRKLEADPRGGPAAARKAIAAEVGRHGRATLEGLDNALVRVPEGERQALVRDILAAMRLTPEKAVRLHIEEEADADSDATASVLRAFDEKLRSGGSLYDAMAAAARRAALYPQDFEDFNLLSPLTYRLLSAEEAESLRVEIAKAERLATAEEIFEGLAAATGDGARSRELIADHRARLERGADPAEEIIRFVREVSRELSGDEGARRWVYAALPAAAGALPPERRKELVEAVSSSQRIPVSDIAWASGIVYTGSSAATAEAGKRAFEAKIRAGGTLAQALVAGYAAIDAERGENERVSLETETLLAMGLLTREEARAARVETLIASGAAAPMIAGLATEFGVEDPREIERRVAERLARPGATYEDGVEELFAALPARRSAAGLAGEVNFARFREVLANADPARRPELAKKLIERTGSTIEEAARRIVFSSVGPDAMTGSRAEIEARWTRELARGGIRGAVVALAKELLRGWDLEEVEEVRELIARLVGMGLLSEADGESARSELGVG